VAARVIDGIDRPCHVREGDPAFLAATDPGRLQKRDPAPADRFGAVLVDLERPHLPWLDVCRARNGSQHWLNLLERQGIATPDSTTGVWTV
jgi:hypothetical protein